MAKKLEDMTPERLKAEFIGPLSSLVLKMTEDCDRLQKAVAAGRLDRNYLPMNIVIATKAVKRLGSFYTKEFHTKLNDALEGELRYREAERKEKNE